MEFPSAADAVVAGILQLARFDGYGRSIRQFVTGQTFAGDFYKSDSLDLGRGAGEALLNQLG